MIIKKHYAFTLAEVLITLGIIGVVVTMTMLTLMNNHQKTQAATQLEKGYSEISQAIKLSEGENGPAQNWDWSIATDNPGRVKFVDIYLLPYLKIDKNCGYTNYTSDCVNSPKYFLNGSPANHSGYFVYLADGKSLQIFAATSYLQILIDINGNKPPNKYGKDIFEMGIYDWVKPYYTLVFRGRGGSRTAMLDTGAFGCNKQAASDAGAICGALIQQDGWQIKDDYPWE